MGGCAERRGAYARRGGAGGVQSCSQPVRATPRAVLSQALLIMCLSSFNACSTNKASRTLHHTCVLNLLHAPSSWWESTPSGRVLSRFSGDLSMLDRMFAFILDDCSQFFFILLAFLAVIILLIPQMAARGDCAPPARHAAAEAPGRCLRPRHDTHRHRH